MAIKSKRSMNAAMSGCLECIAVLALAVILVYGILQRSGTLTSGYHFLDDHELIRMEQAFQNGAVTLDHAVKNCVVNDLAIRFRPFYWVERVIGTYFFGSELLYWNYYTAVKGVMAFCLLYWMARFLKYNRIVSALVPCVVMLGDQFMPWFRSANQESTGVLLAAFVLCMIAAQSYCRKYTAWYYNIPIVAGAVLCGLVKESFTLFMPVFIGVKFWLEYWDIEKEPEKGRFMKCLKSNLIPGGIIFLAMAVNVWMILFRVGTDKIGYAGFDQETALWVYRQGIINSLFDYTKLYTDMGIVILLLAIVCYRAMDKRNLKKQAGLALIAGCAMAVQLVAHAKSGMAVRYMLPYTIAYVFLFVFVAYHFFEKDRVQRIVFYMVLLWLAGNGARSAYMQAEGYTQTGRDVSLLLNEACTRTQEDESILCAFYDEELNLASECWLETHGRPIVYSRKNDGFEDKVQLTDNVPESYSLNDVYALLCYEGQKESMLQLMGLEEGKDCGVYQFGDYMLIVKE